MGLYFLSYLCLIVFVIAVILRIYRQLTLPVHLRWELYPVKHEAGKKAAYGGSYMEESNWWKRKRKRSWINELRYMIPEILFLRGVWEENRRLWWVSFPFHFGLYMLMGTFLLLLLGAILMRFGIPVSPGNGGINSLIYYLTIIVGVIGMISGSVGTAGLLSRRLTAPELKYYSSFADYFNLVFLFSFCGSALLAWLFHDLSFDGARAHVYGLLTFGGLPRGYILDRSFLGGLTVVLTSLVVAYIPMTHMSHMFMKYFMYHFVRWEDEPNLKGSGLEASILQNLGFRPTWAASHIGADGKKTWGEIASSKPKELK
jgi:nitrate reductase gamma subunit